MNNKGSIEKLPEGLDAKWLNTALKSLNVQTDRLNKYAVLPNQNGTFCFQKDLYEDSGIPEELKDKIFDTININYKNILLHKDIDAADFAVVQKKTISSFASELNDALSKMSHYSWGNHFHGSYHRFPKEKIYQVSSYMIGCCPEIKKPICINTNLHYCSVAQAFKLAEGTIGYIEFENKKSVG